MPNPLLALEVQPAQIDIAGSIARGQEVKTQSLGNMLRQYQMKKLQQDETRQNALSSFYQNNGADLAAGKDAAINNLAAIDPTAAQGLKKGALENQKTGIETEDAQIKSAMTKAEFMGRTAQGILEAPAEVRPLLYQRALAEAKAAGLPVDKAPPQYDENAVKQMLAGAISVKDQIAAHQAKAQAEEAARHNRTTEGLTARGQNMVDARARETNNAAEWRDMTQEEKTAKGLPAQAAYQVNAKTGKIERVAGNNSVRPIPSAALAGIQGNRLALSKIDRAIAAIKANPDALGLKNKFPDEITQRIPGKGYEGGVGVRSIIADIGSLKIHDRSGTAVTASETPRLKPFIPSVQDTPEAAIEKLEQLKADPMANLDEAEAFYSPDAGYMSIPGHGKPASSDGKPVAAGVIDFNDLPEN